MKNDAAPDRLSLFGILILSLIHIFPFILFGAAFIISRFWFDAKLRGRTFYGVSAVSYTHLDVYKRQVNAFCNFGNHTCIICWLMPSRHQLVAT